MIQSTITTPRLTLVRLSDTSPGSQHIQLFHENWTDPDATAWSLHGPTKSLEESRDWMIEHMTKYDNLFYSVFTKQENGSNEDGYGEHIGSVSLRVQKAGPTLPLPVADGKEVSLRVLGYALFKKAWGKGYATEANKALLRAYADSVAEEKAKGEKVFWVEACADEGNPGSRAVLRKVGFRELGRKDGLEKVFLAGEWREDGLWVYGMEV